MQQSRDERSLGELFGELARETGTLVRQEVELAKTEMTQRATRAGKDVGSLAVGGAIAYAGFLTLLAALVAGLATVMPVWLAALIVGLVVAVVGYLLVQRGLTALRSHGLAPRQTIETLKEDVEWAKEQVR
jgi:fatty acid desaturase